MFDRKAVACLAFVLLVATPLAYFFADQPIATFAFEHFHQSRQPFVWATKLVDLLDWAVVAGLIHGIVTAARGRAFGPNAARVMRVTLAVFAAMGAKEMAKLAFGRTWPETWTCGNPSFIKDAAFGFTPFHGGAGWGSFPSGHETLICAFAASLWVLAPRSRPFGALAALAVAIGLLGADFHWLSDILAGGVLGSLVGIFVARVSLPAPVAVEAAKGETAGMNVNHKILGNSV